MIVSLFNVYAVIQQKLFSCLNLNKIFTSPRVSNIYVCVCVCVHVTAIQNKVYSLHKKNRKIKAEEGSTNQRRFHLLS